ncbi:MAG: hypothetical protein ACI85I_000915 [Arenicella sp.]|jgi:hypothetical protein
MKTKKTDKEILKENTSILSATEKLSLENREEKIKRMIMEDFDKYDGAFKELTS